MLSLMKPTSLRIRYVVYLHTVDAPITLGILAVSCFQLPPVIREVTSLIQRSFSKENSFSRLSRASLVASIYGFNKIPQNQRGNPQL